MNPDTLPDIGYPWERRENESDAAWRAFVHYRDSPLNQASCAATAQWLTEQGDVKGAFATLRTRCETWSSEHDWVDRRRLWHNELDSRRRQTFLASEGKMHDQHAKQLAAAIATVAAPINSLVRDLNDRGSDVQAWMAGMTPKERFDLALRCAKALPQLMSAEAYSRGLTPIPTELADVSSPAREQAALPTTERAMAVWAAMEQAGISPSVVMAEKG